MVRGKKRIGYELELKVSFTGVGGKSGNEFAFEVKELCDDGSDCEYMIYVTKASNKKSKNASLDLKKEIES